tara:strand:- start:114 stop:554 length:441 start_codon:yes stop_codon:yes gene_type:complete
MIRELIPNWDILLHAQVKKCSYNLDRHFLKKTLIDNMYHHNGVGLSANQIGINERAFVMIRDLEYNEIMTCFNPKIVKQSPKSVIMEEGCLSFPDVILDVKRSESIVVKYEDENKQTHKVKLDGFAARVFLHEFDHMEGIDFTQRK